MSRQKDFIIQTLNTLKLEMEIETFSSSETKDIYDTIHSLLKRLNVSRSAENQPPKSDSVVPTSLLSEIINKKNGSGKPKTKKSDKQPILNGVKGEKVGNKKPKNDDKG
ncbi:hypothetical protein RF11_02527 [Thelohanellus kitauei]|uniref:Uncharacterized protein n=1 Tax=Thelohanellus kitauei TaxID=669202 RepID=A0A0C2IA79_THEKT|nr:hypothetical protein RF11_02527 [Thelohanellus kitauei]